MPAIQPQKLKEEASQLTQWFTEPTEFLRRLEDRLEFYADRTRRPGQSGAPPPLLPAYQVPQPVLRQVERAIRPQARENAQAALALADAMWEKKMLEYKLLAAEILGQVTPQPPEPIVERLIRWANNTQEDRLLDALFKNGLQRVRLENPESFLPQVQEWLQSSEEEKQILGLRALRAISSDPSFGNLPRVFKLITALSYAPPPDLQPFLRNVVQALARRSPKETAFFLQQSFQVSKDPGTAWLIRQTMDIFPNTVQDELRTTMKKS